MMLRLACCATLRKTYKNGVLRKLNCREAQGDCGWVRDEVGFKVFKGLAEGVLESMKRRWRWILSWRRRGTSKSRAGKAGKAGGLDGRMFEGRWLLAAVFPQW